MRKTFAVLFLISFLAVLVVPLTTSAQIADCCRVRRTFTFEGTVWVVNSCPTAVGAVCTIAGCAPAAGTPTANWGMLCILNTIYRVADLIFALLLAAAILVILLGAYTFLTAGGSPDKVGKAQNYILFGLVGLVIAFLARAIPSIVNMLL